MDPQIHVELNQPLPRRVKTTKYFKLLCLVFAMTFLLPLIAIAYQVGGDAYKMHILKTRGQVIQGMIDNLNVVRCGRGHTVCYHVDYHYPVSPTIQPYRITDQIPQSEFAILHENEVVEVVYDPSHPARSAININDRILSQDPFAAARGLSKILLPLFAGLMLWVGGFLLSQYQRDKKLLVYGTVAVGKITMLEEYKGSKGQTLTAATYEFTDSQGYNVRGVRRDLPRKDDKRARSQKIYMEITKNPIVIFDPKNSDQNFLYPSRYAQCV